MLASLKAGWRHYDDIKPESPHHLDGCVASTLLNSNANPHFTNPGFLDW
ncbi:hypothetical protein VIBNISO65_1530007 [Vibrio nigripulchritudo SO65]|nr:hypothetical protein VIBNIAM115_450008 [Vibrio nigripulchritudo AM115]CCN44562.1 hypothetical protein VIBNIFTn2_860007 [Vibrio nigripulchritudo FTn2]CCN66577.1 hypothetical protein VIBNIPon4_570077 [Vibrio nigripulchritudo POn4]CCN76157.1 hypothetical protein VIBNISO65_1530007 [Vibrio nigripulchritudo SO65]